jgi:hypothetical protein
VVDGFVRRMLVPALVCLGAASWSAGAHATKIGLIGADGQGVVDQVRKDLETTGMFSEVIQLAQDAPLATLSAYDALLVWSNDPFKNPVELGDTLGKYVEQGGGVVLATFAFRPDRAIAGAISTPKYSPFSIPGASLETPVHLGSYDPNSPIMTGVSKLTGYYVGAVELNPGAKLVASWEQDAPLLVASLLADSLADPLTTPLAAWNHGGDVVGIALWPYPQFVTGDYARLFANSLVFAADPNATVPEPGTLALLALPLLAGLRFGRRRTSPAS